METTIHITLSEDFETLCSIYQINPEYFVQQFINQVSLPEYYSSPSNNNRWGTLFFLQFLEVELSHYEVNRELEEHFLDTFDQAMQYNYDANPASCDTSMTTGRDIMRNWLKAVLAERAKYITDTL
ncbi:hypothetical protein [Pedobacter sp. L105]|uniref:hypothetical protein n=1 Tax=Pedobacter sp. L105 TaxID=1641871 RepID=UPI00131A7E4A|nr:hypothetical protein [Pedobacter sp. L105]